MRNFLLPLVLAGLLTNAHFAAAQSKRSSSSGGIASKTAAKKKVVRPVAVRQPPPVDPTEGDNVDGDDLTVRRAAVAALGTTNGSVVVVDPTNGRVLTMVNQKLGLRAGFTPCSTIKLVTALAALSEHVIERSSVVRLSRYVNLDLTQALAHSNNPFFANLGTRLGFDRVIHYAQMLGLGEKAGLDIPGEQPGKIPAEPPKYGGVGLMTSFGEGFLMTPLELAGILSAIANGGTLYQLQYPRTESEADQITPQVKRTLDLAPNGIADIKVGMKGAVDFGTARRAGYASSEPILGKTGTCTDFSSSSHMGWFGSFNDVGRHRLVVVVMLAAINKSVSGPIAAGVAGLIYKNLSEQRYFAMADAEPAARSNLPQILVTKPCCDR
jgi:penicillin-binding protein 2